MNETKILEHVALMTRLNEQGVRAETMTLTDLLANQRTAPMAYVIERCYNPAFSREGEILAMPGENDPRLVTIVDALKVVDSL